LDENHRTSEITLPTADDKARAVTELLKMIDTVLQLESTGQLISYQLAEEFAREATDRQPDHKVPSWFHQSAMLESTNLAEDASIEEAEETLSRYNRTLLKANNTIADVPAEQDLNGARAAADLSNYSELARSQILEKGNQLEHDEFWRHVRPILKDFRIGLACDGEPALLLANLFREAKLAFRASWGPWHAKKRAYFAAGDILGVNYLEDVFKVAGRDTPWKLKWVLNPGDTNDVEFETTILAMAILTVASREFAKIAAESDGQGSDSVDISADEVLGHIIT